MLGGYRGERAVWPVRFSFKADAGVLRRSHTHRSLTKDTFVRLETKDSFLRFETKGTLRHLETNFIILRSDTNWAFLCLKWYKPQNRIFFLCCRFFLLP